MYLAGSALQDRATQRRRGRCGAILVWRGCARFISAQVGVARLRRKSTNSGVWKPNKSKKACFIFARGRTDQSLKAFRHGYFPGICFLMWPRYPGLSQNLAPMKNQRRNEPNCFAAAKPASISGAMLKASFVESWAFYENAKGIVFVR